MNQKTAIVGSPIARRSSIRPLLDSQELLSSPVVKMTPESEQWTPDYVFIGSWHDVSIYWSNIHHVFRAIRKVPIETTGTESSQFEGINAFYRTKKYHPSIVKELNYKEPDIEERKPGRVEFEFVPGTSLEELRRAIRNGFCPELLDDTQTLIIIYGLAQAIQFLHKMNIMHRNIRPENVLISCFCEPYLADYCIPKAQGLSFPCDPLYAAPEVISGEAYDLKADVYSFGCVISDFLSLREPVAKREPFLRSSVYSKLVNGCLMENPEDRLSINDVVSQLKEISQTNDCFDYNRILDYDEQLKSEQNGRLEEGTVKNLQKAAKRGFPKAQMLWGSICQRHSHLFDPEQSEDEGIALRNLGKIALRL